MALISEKQTFTQQCEEFDNLYNFGQLLSHNIRMKAPMSSLEFFRYGYDSNLLTSIPYMNENRKRYDVSKYSIEKLNDLDTQLALENVFTAIKNKLMALKDTFFGKTKNLANKTVSSSDQVLSVSDDVYKDVSNTNEEELNKPRKKVIPWKMIGLMITAVAAFGSIILICMLNWRDILSGSPSTKNKLDGIIKNIPEGFKVNDISSPIKDKTDDDPLTSVKQDNFSMSVMKATLKNSEVEETSASKVGWTKAGTKIGISKLRKTVSFVKNAPHGIWSFVKNIFKSTEHFAENYNDINSLDDDISWISYSKKKSCLEILTESNTSLENVPVLHRFTTAKDILRIIFKYMKRVFLIALTIFGCIAFVYSIPRRRVSTIYKLVRGVFTNG